MDQINTAKVVDALKPIWSSKSETATRVRSRIEWVLDAAKAKGYRSGENPARWKGHLDQLLPKRARLTRGHHAALPFADVPAFIKDLRTRPAMSALALEFTILTAARSGEVRGAATLAEFAARWYPPIAACNDPHCQPYLRRSMAGSFMTVASPYDPLRPLCAKAYSGASGKRSCERPSRPPERTSPIHRR